MSDTATPFPKLPDPPADPGEYLTYFDCHIAKFAFDRAGSLVLQVAVDDLHKYMAMPLSDIRGRQFRMLVYAEKGRNPLVRAGTAAVYEGRSRVAEGRKNRRWERVRREVFEGDDD